MGTAQNQLKEFNFETVIIKNRGLSGDKLSGKLNREIKNGIPVAKLLDTLCFFMIRTLQTMRKMEQYSGYTWENYKKYCGIIEPLIRQLYREYHAKTTSFVKQNLMNVADNIQLIIGMNTGGIHKNSNISKRSTGSHSGSLRRTNNSRNGGYGSNNGNSRRNIGIRPTANKFRNTTRKISNNSGKTSRLKRYGAVNTGNLIENKLKRTTPILRSNSERK